VVERVPQAAPLLHPDGAGTASQRGPDQICADAEALISTFCARSFGCPVVSVPYLMPKRTINLAAGVSLRRCIMRKFGAPFSNEFRLGTVQQRYGTVAPLLRGRSSTLC